MSRQMVVTHSVSTGVRWYEIRNINTGGIDGAPVLFQQGTYPNPSGITRWMATMAMDKVGSVEFEQGRYNSRGEAHPPHLPNITTT